MPLLVPNDSEIRLLDYLGTVFNADPTQIHLFQNNHTPADGDTVADYTECTFSGYLVKTLLAWSAAATVSGRAEITEALQTWGHTGGATGNNVYGYYITDFAGNLLWAELDPAGPVLMDSSGQTYSVLPRFTLRSQP